jgi:hypothetical protein
MLARTTVGLPVLPTHSSSCGGLTLAWGERLAAATWENPNVPHAMTESVSNEIRTTTRVRNELGTSPSEFVGTNLTTNRD